LGSGAGVLYRNSPLADSPQRAGTINPRDHKPCFFQKGGLGYEKDSFFAAQYFPSDNCDSFGGPTQYQHKRADE
jgi:hypothetical protein